MPKTTRKYPTKQKTTTKEGNNEWHKYAMQNYRKRKKAEQENLSKEYHRLYWENIELKKLLGLPLEKKRFTKKVYG